MSMTDIQVIEQQGLRVLTTAQLAECYGCESKMISNNFANNKHRYEEGKHYICLQGADLQAFKNKSENLGIVTSRVNKLYLWTERGALLHAKSLNTDKAWEVYDQLVETYFRAKKAETALQNLSPQLQFMIRIETEQNEMRKDLDGAIQRIEELESREPAAKQYRKERKRPAAVGEPKKWDEREKDYLRNSFKMGLTDIDIAAELGRSVSSIQNKRRSLGLNSLDGSHWTKAEDRKLLELADKGLTYTEISKIIGRKYGGVSSRLARLRKERNV